MAKRPSELTDNEIAVLTAAITCSNGGVLWIQAADAFDVGGVRLTRAARSMRGHGYIRVDPLSPDVWLTAVPGAGARPGDPPAKLMEITAAGQAVLRRRVGDEPVDQLLQYRAVLRTRVINR